ncbi:MAG: Acetoin:2,6-dichlorophenolindophenol oxidoreductase subunit alpha [Holosporales bacterium]
MTSLNPALLTQFYEQMLLIRRFEERAGQLYGQGLIGGFCHLYIGQEAVVTGIQAAQKPQDTVITSYRDHGHMLVCGMDPRGVMAELTGRSGGYSKGKGGSMHMFSKEKNFYGGHGIVGAQISLGAGLAFAHKYKKDQGVCVAYMGDGAANQGQVYESFNMAALWNLPIVFVIEDNQYAMGTSTCRGTSNTDFSKRGEPYNIPSRIVDGMNVLSVYEDALWALDHARTKGPTLLHVKTYRYRGHSMSDPAKYRSKEEVDQIRDERDPIETLKKYLQEQNILTDDDFKAIDDKIKTTMLETVEFSKTSPEPNITELYTDVLV